MSDLRIVTLEEHYATPEHPGEQNVPLNADIDRFQKERISDIAERRLPEMDANGVDIQVLSSTMPAVQWIKDTTEAVETATKMNNSLAAAFAPYEDRFAGFAALPCQDPAAAATELRRCVQELGFVGAMIHGHTHGVYLDDERFEVLWSEFESLDVPLYLHPTFPPEAPPVLRGYPILFGAAWGWAFETASHVLRMVAGGVFDRHPNAQVITGHMGENLPFALNRLDDRWAVMIQEKPLRHEPSYYIRNNTYLTTAGSEDDNALRCAIEAVGLERVLFSIDYPYQFIDSAVNWMHAAPLSDDERVAICSGNADALLGLKR